MRQAATESDPVPMLWTVTTSGDLPDDFEQRSHETPHGAWDDYAGRILELEINGYTCASGAAVQYGRRWVCKLTRGIENITVEIERSA